MTNSGAIRIAGSSLLWNYGDTDHLVIFETKIDSFKFYSSPGFSIVITLVVADGFTVSF